MTIPGSIEAVQKGFACPISDEIKEKLGKTVMIFDNEEGIDFIVLDGDFSELNGQYLNAEGDELLAELMYDNVTGEPKVKFLKEFPLQEVLNGAKVVVCGFAS